MTGIDWDKDPGVLALYKYQDYVIQTHSQQLAAISMARMLYKDLRDLGLSAQPPPGSSHESPVCAHGADGQAVRLRWVVLHKDGPDIALVSVSVPLSGPIEYNWGWYLMDWGPEPFQIEYGKTWPPGFLEFAKKYKDRLVPKR